MHRCYVWLRFDNLLLRCWWCIYALSFWPFFLDIGLLLFLLLLLAGSSWCSFLAPSWAVACSSSSCGHLFFLLALIYWHALLVVLICFLCSTKWLWWLCGISGFSGWCSWAILGRTSELVLWLWISESDVVRDEMEWWSFASCCVRQYYPLCDGSLVLRSWQHACMQWPSCLQLGPMAQIPIEWNLLSMDVHRLGWHHLDLALIFGDAKWICPWFAKDARSEAKNW